MFYRRTARSLNLHPPTRNKLMSSTAPSLNYLQQRVVVVVVVVILTAAFYEGKKTDGVASTSTDG